MSKAKSGHMTNQDQGQKDKGRVSGLRQKHGFGCDMALGNDRDVQLHRVDTDIILTFDGCRRSY